MTDQNKKETEQYYKLTEDNEIKKELTWDFILEQVGKKRFNGKYKSFFNEMNEQVRKKQNRRII